MRHIVKKHFETGAAIVMIVALLVFGAVVFQTLYIQGGGNTGAVYSSSIFRLANDSRKDTKAQELTVSPLLEEAARRKANDMVENGYFAHTSPDGKTPWYWLKDVGYSYNFAGENLAVNFTDSGKVHKAWMNSELHRKNILDSRFTEIGIATAKGYFNGKDTVFIVQMFGSPKTTTFAASVISVPLDFIASNPHQVLVFTYSILALLVGLSLLAYIGGEWKKHHIKHVVYGVLILAILVAGVILYNIFFGGEVIII